MTVSPTKLASSAVLLAGCFIALIGSREWAGSWNDSSRLATVESLVDHHTLAIDEAVYVRAAESSLPPGPGRPPIRTKDKLLIDGHFYSDKSPVPAVLMTPLYLVWKAATGKSAPDDLESFVYWMSLGSSGLAYVVAVWCVFQLTLVLGLPLKDSLLLTASFGLATVAPVYARQVNNHILLLAVAAALFLSLVQLARSNDLGKARWPLLLGVGSLAGLGYAIDLGAGPPLLLCTLALVVYRCRAWRPVILAGLAALPWVALNHAMNYATGGTFKPANAVPEYLAWLGSPFDAHNMTGMLNHGSVEHFLLYAGELLVGKPGFLGHNLPLFLAVALILPLLKRRVAESPEMVCCVVWSLGTWLLYAATSTNGSGLCCSVRWLVPLLAPGYLILALGLREWPVLRSDLLVLTGGGVVLTAHLWYRGPWAPRLLELYWPLQACVLVSWLSYRLNTWRKSRWVDPSRPRLADSPRAAA